MSVRLRRLPGDGERALTHPRTTSLHSVFVAISAGRHLGQLVREVLLVGSTPNTQARFRSRPSSGRYPRLEMVLSPNSGGVRVRAFGRPNGVGVWTSSNPVLRVVPGSNSPFWSSKFRPSGLSGGSVCPGSLALIGPVHHTDILAHERGVLG